MKKFLMFAAVLMTAAPAFAQEAAASSAVGGTLGLAVVGLGIMMGLAVLGGALGQSNAANAALDGIARNPSAAKEIRGTLVLALALMESLVLFAFLIAILLQGPIGKAFGTLAPK